MSVPKKRASSRARKTRASHHALKATNLTTCSKCDKPVQPHQVCQNCGFYKGRDVLNLEAKLTKRELKKKQKEDAKQAQQAEAAAPEEKTDDKTKAVV